MQDVNTKKVVFLRGEERYRTEPRLKTVEKKRTLGGTTHVTRIKL